MRPSFNEEQNWYRLRDDEVIRVRLFSAKGMYPRGHLALPQGFFHADEDIATLVTKGFSWTHYFEESSFDEFGWPFPEEIRFMGSMVLCEKQGEVTPLLYPLQEPTFLLDPATVDLRSSQNRHSIVDLLKDTNRWPARSHFIDKFSQRGKQEIPLFDAAKLELERLESTWERMRPTDFVLLRGLSALIKSDMLSRHSEFGAKALMSLYVALECSFQLVLQHLRERGNANPSANDAARWMHDTFDSHFDFDPPDASYKYFEEFYQGRIAAFHPRNRFGDFPFSPNFWDDLIHLRRSLPRIFAFILHGNHSSSFFAEVREFHGKWEAAP
ncbi:hypothetical protein I5U65_06965 [Stenotrophomonas maltophilia]|nr:hypothetical protein [Stenotrophomonas maltophilia]